MKTLEEIKAAISRLSPAEMRQLLDWTDNNLEDRREMTDEFKGQIKSSEHEKADGLRPRTR